MTDRPMTPNPTSPVTSTRAGDEMIQATSSASEKVCDHPSTEKAVRDAEYVKKVVKALRAGHQYSGIVDPIDTAAADLIEVLYLETVREETIEECAKIARSMALQMLAGMKLPADVRASDSQLSFGHKIADYIEADIRALASLSPLKD